MIKMRRTNLFWLMIAAVFGSVFPAMAQDDNATIQIAVGLKGQRNPKLAAGFRQHRLSPELRALQKVEGGVLVGRTKRSEAVIVTTKKAASRLFTESEHHQVDVRSEPEELDLIDRLILSYDKHPPTDESLKEMGLVRVEDYPDGTFTVVKPIPGRAITDKTAEALFKNPQVTRAYPSYRMSLFPPDPAAEDRPVANPKPKGAQAEGQPAPIWPKLNNVRSQASPIFPNDADFDRLWGMKAINAPSAWTAITDSPVIVGVIDTGVDYEHPDLKANMWRSPRGTVGYNAITGQEDPMDDDGHGTHCAGTIAAVANNQLGVAGVTWNVQVMALKFIKPNVGGSDIDAIKCIDYALRNGATVLSNSWGGYGYDPELDEAIGRAQSRGALFIAAAGNGGDDHIGDDNEGDEPHYPSSYEHDNLIAVMSVDSNGEKSSFSNFGQSHVHLAAPGRGIYSTFLGRRYKELSGTSMAAPHVAGAAALTWGHPRYRGADWRTIKQALEKNATRLPSLKRLCATEGVLDLAFLADTTLPDPGSHPAKPPTKPSTPGQPPIGNNVVARVAADFKDPQEVVDAGNLLCVRLQLAEPCEVWIRASTSVTSNADIMDASISFLHEKRVDQRWASSARYFSLRAGHWTAVSTTHTVNLDAGTHVLYWKLWDEDSNGATLTLNAGTMTVEAIPIRTE